MNPLILHLKDKYYWMIRHGEKTHEYREFKPYWISRIHLQKELIVCPGYVCDNSYDIKADIVKISVISFKDLPDYAKDEFKKSKYKEFFDIEFKVGVIK